MKTKEKSLKHLLLEKHKVFSFPYSLLDNWCKQRMQSNMVISYFKLRFALFFLTLFCTTVLAVSLVHDWNLENIEFLHTFVALIPTYIIAVVILSAAMILSWDQLSVFAVDLKLLAEILNTTEAEVIKLTPGNIEDLTHKQLYQLAFQILKLQKQGEACEIKEAIEPMRESFRRIKTVSGKFYFVLCSEHYFGHAESQLAQQVAQRQDAAARNETILV